MSCYFFHDEGPNHNRNQYIDLQSELMDWCLYDRVLHHERVKGLRHKDWMSRNLPYWYRNKTIPYLQNVSLRQINLWHQKVHISKKLPIYYFPALLRVNRLTISSFIYFFCGLCRQFKNLKTFLLFTFILLLFS